MKDYNIRHAVIEDLAAISELEALCFPKEEAAAEESFYNRLKIYPDCFWLLTVNNKIVSMINGMVSDSAILLDEMYTDASMHNGMGDWQMIFGVETRPQYRRKGYGGLLMKNVIEDVKSRNRKGLVLTCKKELIHYYEKFGFVNEGVSRSEHGGQLWYQMKLAF